MVNSVDTFVLFVYVNKQSFYFIMHHNIPKSQLLVLNLSFVENLDFGANNLIIFLSFKLNVKVIEFLYQKI